MYHNGLTSPSLFYEGQERSEGKKPSKDGRRNAWMSKELLSKIRREMDSTHKRWNLVDLAGTGLDKSRPAWNWIL